MKIIFFCICLLLIIEGAYSQKLIVFTQNSSLDKGDISRFVEVYRDNTKKLAIEEIRQKNFEPYRNGIFDNISYADIIWIKFNIYNDRTDTIKLDLSFQKNFFLDLFQIKSNKETLLVSGGGFSNKISSFSPYNLPLKVSPGDTSQIFIRIVFNTFSLQHKKPLVILQSNKTALFNQKDFFLSRIALISIYFFTCNLLIFALFFGIIHYFSHFDKSILYYLIVIVCSLLMVVRVAELNLDLKILPQFLPLLNPFQLIFQLVLGSGYLLFFNSMFEVHLQHPKSYKFAKWIFLIYALLFILSLYLTFYTILQRSILNNSFTILGLISTFILMSTMGLAITILKDNHSYKRLIIYGYFCMFSGYAIMIILNRTGYDFSNSFWKTPSVYMCIGIILEFLFFILALSKRGQFLEKEALIKGQNLERKRVASELHNNVNSILASVKMSLQAMPIMMKTESEVFEKVLRMVDNASREVRQISHNMLPTELEKEGLVQALIALFVRLNLGGQTHFELNLNGFNKKINIDIAFNLYSICLELCQNIQKHSDARNAQLELQVSDNKLVMFISDDGKGFEYEKIVEGMGLKNIQHRAKSIGADLRIQSELGEGTTIYLIVKI